MTGGSFEIGMQTLNLLLLTLPKDPSSQVGHGGPEKFKRKIEEKEKMRGMKYIKFFI
jgi:hypothetical protein